MLNTTFGKCIMAVWAIVFIALTFKEIHYGFSYSLNMILSLCGVLVGLIYWVTILFKKNISVELDYAIAGSIVTIALISRIFGR